MRIVFEARWYDPDKVRARAEERGFDGSVGACLLDYYHPDEDPSGAEVLECRDLLSATTHLRNIVAEGGDFFGQGLIREITVDGPRCKYCSCNGRKIVWEHVVEETGIVQTTSLDDCA